MNAPSPSTVPDPPDDQIDVDTGLYLVVLCVVVIVSIAIVEVANFPSHEGIFLFAHFVRAVLAVGMAIGVATGSRMMRIITVLYHFSSPFVLVLIAAFTDQQLAAMMLLALAPYFFVTYLLTMNAKVAKYFAYVERRRVAEIQNDSGLAHDNLESLDRYRSDPSKGPSS